MRYGDIEPNRALSKIFTRVPFSFGKEHRARTKVSVFRFQVSAFLFFLPDT
jgi:hypothetical protein